jgi:hypothetical protein
MPVILWWEYPALGRIFARGVAAVGTLARGATVPLIVLSYLVSPPNKYAKDSTDEPPSQEDDGKVHGEIPTHVPHSWTTEIWNTLNGHCKVASIPEKQSRVNLERMVGIVSASDRRSNSYARSKRNWVGAKA